MYEILVCASCHERVECTNVHFWSAAMTMPAQQCGLCGVVRSVLRCRAAGLYQKALGLREREAKIEALRRRVLFPMKQRKIDIDDD
jgi:hypothetical protein